MLTAAQEQSTGQSTLPLRRSIDRIDCRRVDRESFRESFCENSSKKIAHRSDVMASLGSRELRAVKILASYDAWRPPKRKKNDLVKIRFFFWSRKSIFRRVSWILEELDNFRRQHQLQRQILLQINLF